MTNFEKIKNELENLEEIYPICYIAVHKLGLSRNDGECDDTCCQKCEKEAFKWLLEEYKEPILNEEGKEFLKQLIAPFISNEIVSVCKNKDLQILRIDYKIGWTCYSKKVLREKWDWFKNLDSESCYTSEELGLCERLKGK